MTGWLFQACSLGCLRMIATLSSVEHSVGRVEESFRGIREVLKSE
jgi:hypothetical protein